MGRVQVTFAVSICCAALISCVLLAQVNQTVGMIPSFEVAEVRTYRPGAGMKRVQGIITIAGILTNYSQIPGGRIQPGSPVFDVSGRVTMRSVTLRQIVTQAYKELADISPFEAVQVEYLRRGPGWLDSDRFELVAEASPGTPVDTARLMLQKLLAERFHLVVHREQRSMSVYALVRGRKELMLRETEVAGNADCKKTAAIADKDGNFRKDGRTHAVCTSVTMAVLADRLPLLEPFDLDQPVVDDTALAGTYTFNFDWTSRSRGNPDGTSGVSIFGALEALGLKLETRKMLMPIVVIDRIDREPTEN